jgi:hypothetical protein
MTHSRDQKDNDIHKGAVEDDSPHQEHNTSMRGQLPHRTQDPMIKGNDTDYPEPGENPEHSGEPEENPEAQNQTQQPGHRPKQSQTWRKEDLLAS